MTPVFFDEIGEWSQIKLEIIEKFATAYSRIFGAEKQHRFQHEYVDAFAGPGLHISKATGQIVAGSPLRALDVNPPFKAYHFIDLDGDKAALLERLVQERGAAARVYRGDCNDILLTQILPTLRYENYKRALCLLDPYLSGFRLVEPSTELAGAYPIVLWSRLFFRDRPAHARSAPGQLWFSSAGSARAILSWGEAAKRAQPAKRRKGGKAPLRGPTARPGSCASPPG